ncbi:lipoprotein insertase outer membrane protein LolB [Pseudaeromonas sharmana]|uniref:Outer-membrane lipoprotein LolB n=1 Tax=Pseudaeromonas sharmana TaxID=328412 RepID=A0ABV8CRN1_9GAMM
MRSLLRVTIILLVAVLTGCVQQASDGRYNEAVWRGQRESLEQLQHWQLSGKLAIITAQEKGSARLNWQQQGEDYDLILTTIVGTTLLELHKRDNRVTIIDRDGVQHSGEDSDELVYRLTGWPIPIKQLPVWIKGLPGEATFETGDDGRITRLQQGDWQLSYQDYARTRLWLLPTAINLQGPQTRIKLAINEWQINQ